MSRLARLTATARRLTWPATAGAARLRQFTSRPTRFAGAWPDRASALDSLPPDRRKGYDNPGVADVSFEAMAQVVPSDYPVLFWLHRLLQPDDRILDAGGHLGTKYIAFEEHLPLDRYTWTVQDVPAIIAAAREAQNSKRLPAALDFVEAPDDVAADVLLASGLLQYLDIPFTDYVSRLKQRPRHIVLNKVATRKGPDVVTLEQIGPARVPYRIRNRTAFESELSTLGYELKDDWDLPGLSHIIPTHPWLGPSLSRGYLLTRTQP